MSRGEEPDKKDVKPGSTSDDIDPAATAMGTTSNEAKQEVGAPYPLDIPSPILLASSMIIAIAATGTWERK